MVPNLTTPSWDSSTKRTGHAVADPVSFFRFNLVAPKGGAFPGLAVFPPAFVP